MREGSQDRSPVSSCYATHMTTPNSCKIKRWMPLSQVDIYAGSNNFQLTHAPNITSTLDKHEHKVTLVLLYGNNGEQRMKPIRQF